jgi:hypothetical protein
MRVVRIASAGVVLASVGVLASAAAAKPLKLPVSVVSVRAFPVATQRGPSKGRLDATNLNVVTASSALAFRVVVHNQSASQQTHVRVILMISRSGQRGSPPIVHTVSVGTVPAKNTRAVTFKHLGAIPFAARTNLSVAVPHGEGRVYPVIFSLPSGNGTTPNVSGTPLRMPPKVIGLDQQTALQRLEDAGFQVFVTSVYAKQPAGRVVGWRTGRGIRVTGGTSSAQVVAIDVSNGKKPG